MELCNFGKIGTGFVIYDNMRKRRDFFGGFVFNNTLGA